MRKKILMFKSNNGLKQGCVIGSLLFNIMLYATVGKCKHQSKLYKAGYRKIVVQDNRSGKFESQYKDRRRGHRASQHV